MPHTTTSPNSFRIHSAKSKFLSSAIALLMSPIAYAAPEIKDISVIDSSHIEITGTGFGAGPRVALFEDFNDASMVESDVVKLNPPKGSWSEQSGTGYVESTAERDDQILIVRDSQLGSQSKFVFAEEDSSGIHGKKHFQEIYLSYTEKDFRDFPGRNGTEDSFSDVSSAKPVWLMFGNRGDNTSYAISKGSPEGHDLVVATWAGVSFATGGNNTNMSPSFWHHELKNNWAFQDWNTISFHAELDKDDPYGKANGFIWFVNKNFALKKQRDGNFMSDQTEQGVPYPYWDRVKFYPWIRTGESDVKRAVDNIYIAVGANSNARVVLTDDPALEKSRVLVHALPIDWSDSSITVRLPTDSRNPSYIHVINSSETASKGEFLCRNCPNPTQLEVN